MITSHRSSLQKGQIFFNSNPVLVTDSKGLGSYSTSTRNMWTRPITTPSPQLPAEGPVLPVVAPPHPPLPVVVVDRRRGGHQAELAQQDAPLLIQAPVVGLEKNKNRLCSMTCGIENKLWKKQAPVVGLEKKQEQTLFKDLRN